MAYLKTLYQWLVGLFRLHRRYVEAQEIEPLRKRVTALEERVTKIERGPDWIDTTGEENW